MKGTSRILGLIVLAGAGYLLKTLLPDIQRYLRMRNM